MLILWYLKWYSSILVESPLFTINNVRNNAQLSSLNVIHIQYSIYVNISQLETELAEK